MKLFETQKKGYCAICGAKIENGWYNAKTEYEDSVLYQGFTCCACGNTGEDVYSVATEYIGTNGWVATDS